MCKCQERLVEVSMLSRGYSELVDTWMYTSGHLCYPPEKHMRNTQTWDEKEE